MKRCFMENHESRLAEALQDCGRVHADDESTIGCHHAPKAWESAPGTEPFFDPTVGRMGGQRWPLLVCPDCFAVVPYDKTEAHAEAAHGK